jgi:hypothetical protein
MSYLTRTIIVYKVQCTTMLSFVFNGSDCTFCINGSTFAALLDGGVGLKQHIGGKRGASKAKQGAAKGYTTARAGRAHPTCTRAGGRAQDAASSILDQVGRLRAYAGCCSGGSFRDTDGGTL